MIGKADTETSEVVAFISWLVVLGLTALLDSISMYIRPSARERKKEERNNRRQKLECLSTDKLSSPLFA